MFSFKWTCGVPKNHSLPSHHNWDEFRKVDETFAANSGWWRATWVLMYSMVLSKLRAVLEDCRAPHWNDFHTLQRWGFMPTLRTWPWCNCAWEWVKPWARNQGSHVFCAQHKRASQVACRGKNDLEYERYTVYLNFNSEILPKMTNHCWWSVTV